MEKIKEVVYNDLELYFYLYRDKGRWDLAVAPTYIDRARTTRGFFVEVLERYCLDHHINIYNRETDNHGTMMFHMEREELSHG